MKYVLRALLLGSVACVAFMGYALYLTVVSQPGDAQVIELKASWVDLEASVATLVNTIWPKPLAEAGERQAASKLTDNAPVSGLDNNVECWRGASPPQDISCRALSDEFLMSLRGATKLAVVRAMKVTGLERVDGRLHFISDYGMSSQYSIDRWGSGDVDFRFDEAGRVYVIFAVIFGPKWASADYVWNRESLPTGCSDLAQSKLGKCP